MSTMSIAPTLEESDTKRDGMSVVHNDCSEKICNANSICRTQDSEGIQVIKKKQFKTQHSMGEPKPIPMPG